MVADTNTPEHHVVMTNHGELGHCTVHDKILSLHNITLDWLSSDGCISTMNQQGVQLEYNGFF